MVHSLPPWVWVGAWILAFIAGIINAVGFLSFEHQAVTHLTGTTTLLGVAIAASNFLIILHLLGVLGSFFFGAVVSGLVIQNSTLKLGRRYSIVLLLESVVLIVAVQLLYQNKIWGTYLAGFACGLQNAMASTYSGTVIRTSHVTGMITDLGIFLGHRIKRTSIDLKRLRLCLIVLSAFLMGAIFGALCFRWISYSTLYFPSLLTGITGLAYGMFRSIKVRKKTLGHEI